MYPVFRLFAAANELDFHKLPPQSCFSSECFAYSTKLAKFSEKENFFQNVKIPQTDKRDASSSSRLLTARGQTPSTWYATNYMWTFLYLVDLKTKKYF